MAINIGARRAAKNQRRKVVVAEKRKLELEANTTAGRVRQTLAWPIQHCLVSETLFGDGMGIVVIARGETPASLSMATFLLDTFGLGVKDVYFRPTSGGQFADDVRHMSPPRQWLPPTPPMPGNSSATSRSGRAAWGSRRIAISRRSSRFSVPSKRTIAMSGSNSGMADAHCSSGTEGMSKGISHGSPETLWPQRNRSRSKAKRWRFPPGITPAWNNARLG